MSQCVEREEEEGTDRPESSTSSCVSMESDWSKGKPPDVTNETRPLHTNITALPLSATDMAWLEDITQSCRDFNVNMFVESMSTGDPAEDRKNLVPRAQNIERNIYESANSQLEYCCMMKEEIAELNEKHMSMCTGGHYGGSSDYGHGSRTSIETSDYDYESRTGIETSDYDCGSRTGVETSDDGSRTGVETSDDHGSRTSRTSDYDYGSRTGVETSDDYGSRTSRTSDYDYGSRTSLETSDYDYDYDYAWIRLETSDYDSDYHYAWTSVEISDYDYDYDYDCASTSVETSDYDYGSRTSRGTPDSGYGSRTNEEPRVPDKMTKIQAQPATDDDYWECKWCDSRNTAEDLRCRHCRVINLDYSITALPLSAAHMRKYWHKDSYVPRNSYVRYLVLNMLTRDPAEDRKNTVTLAQNIERNLYESANSQEEYRKLMEKVSEPELKRRKMDMSGLMKLKSMGQRSTPPLPLGEKGTIPLHDEMEELPVTESLSSLHPSLELQDETDLSSCFSGLRIEESISLPRSHSLSSLSQIPCLENKTSFRAKRSHSVNDVTLLDKTQKFTPDITNKESYRFHSTQTGLFQCRVTDLVFKMEAEGYVTYRTVHWDRSHLSQLSKRPAGPLFDIQGSQGSVCQLHFPHCEILSTGGGKSLYVVHVMDDERMELIYPDAITETHVIINVTGFSPYGVVNDEDSTNPIWANVALFFTPPNGDDDSTLKVLLLPRNVVLDEVKNKRRKLVGEEIYIGKPPCKLIPNQEYTLSSSPQHDSITIEPLSAVFEVHDSYQNYIETFEVILEERFKRITLLLSNSNTSNCQWKGNVKLSGPFLGKEQVQRTQSLEEEERLYSVRDSFIDSISLPNLNCLLDKLFAKEVLTDAERETGAEIQAKKEKARFVIDTVRRKGSDASSSMILILCDLDTCLSKHLGLM